MLTICYITNRREPRIQWFWSSLYRECEGNMPAAGVGRVVVVDFYALERPLYLPSAIRPDRPTFCTGPEIVHVPPKPNVWNGPHRLTSKNYFAAANARNTGLCLAPNGFIAYVDDLAVLVPGWLSRVKAAMVAEDERVVCGAYQKVKKLVVDAGGNITNFEHFEAGVDTRWRQAGDEPKRLGGGALYGCSFVAPVEAMLRINGFDEDNDPMGGEDYCLGLMLERMGYPVYYDRKMFTMESEEDHHVEPPFVRVIKKSEALAPDATWAMLRMVNGGGRTKAVNYFGPEGIRGLRDRVLAGEPFPVCQIPQHDWRDGQPLSEM